MSKFDDEVLKERIVTTVLMNQMAIMAALLAGPHRSEVDGPLEKTLSSTNKLMEDLLKIRGGS